MHLMYSVSMVQLNVWSSSTIYSMNSRNLEAQSNELSRTHFLQTYLLILYKFSDQFDRYWSWVCNVCRLLYYRLNLQMLRDFFSFRPCFSSLTFNFQCIIVISCWKILNCVFVCMRVQFFQFAVVVHQIDYFYKESQIRLFALSFNFHLPSCDEPIIDFIWSNNRRQVE